MSKAAWKTLFGLKLSRWTGRDLDRRPLPEDCDVVITRASLRAGGVKNPTRTLLKLERDRRFHHKVVIFPDGRRGKATAVQSYSWLLGVQRDEDRKRSLANLMVGDQVLETIVTNPQGSGAPFVPEIWPVPVAPPALSTAPPPAARERRAIKGLERAADRAVAIVRNDRELYSDIEDHLCGEVLRILTAAEAPIGRDDIAAELLLPPSGEEGRALAMALRRLTNEGAIIGKPEARRFLYRAAP